MRRMIAATVLLGLAGATAGAQKHGLSPAETALGFYRALKEKRYVDGFGRSVYRDAVKGLSASELQELEPDFARTFSSIPDKIEPRGEQITGDLATVFLKFEGVEQLQQVQLIRVGGEWLVGDRESLGLVRAQGRAFFFTARIAVNESDVYEMLSRIIGAETVYASRFEGRYGSLEELMRLGALPKDLEGGAASGYRFTLTTGADQRSFSAIATPVQYGKTGKLSFYADINGVRAEDASGKPASAKSPVYEPR